MYLKSQREFSQNLAANFASNACRREINATEKGIKSTRRYTVLQAENLHTAN